MVSSYFPPPQLLTLPASIIALLLIYVLVFYLFLLFLDIRNKDNCSSHERNSYLTEDDEKENGRRRRRLFSSKLLSIEEYLKKKIPSFYYGLGWSSGCVICLEGFEDGQECRIFPICKHMFHSQCVDPWFINRNFTCPLCRTQVIIEEKVIID